MIRNSAWEEITKKLVLAVVVLGLLFLGCNIEEQKPGISTIKNTSTNFDVNFKFKDNIDHTIVKGNEKTYFQPLHDYIVSYEPSKRVLLNTKYPHENDVVYTFTERQSYTVKVNNTIGENVTLSAGGWMDKMIDIANGDGDDDNHTGKVYTDKPDFEVVSSNGYPAKAVCNFKANTFKVIIAWGD